MFLRPTKECGSGEIFVAEEYNTALFQVMLGLKCKGSFRSNVWEYLEKDGVPQEIILVA